MEERNSQATGVGSGCTLVFEERASSKKRFILPQRASAALIIALFRGRCSKRNVMSREICNKVTSLQRAEILVEEEERDRAVSTRSLESVKMRTRLLRRLAREANRQGTVANSRKVDEIAELTMAAAFGSVGQALTAHSPVVTEKKPKPCRGEASMTQVS